MVNSTKSKLNCEVLHEQLAFEVRWALAGDSIVVQLVAKLEDGEYVSFGLSGNDRHNKMIGGDVVVAWVDHETLSGNAIDYFLEGKSQCAGNRGSCPDYVFQENADSVRLLNAALVNGYSIITYQRPIKAHDVWDKTILTNTSQAVIWAIGPLNSKQETSFHSIFSKRDTLLNFGRTPKWNCPIPESDAALAASNEGSNAEQYSLSPQNEDRDSSFSKNSGSYKTPPPPAAVTNADQAWKIPPIECNEPEDGILYAQMGPTGGKHGYSAITKHVGWGTAYFINGLLIPEINVVRGKTYTFVTEGGNDSEFPAKFHPFYITDDPIGGYEHKSPQEKQSVRIFAGVDFDEKGNAIPIGTGRYCSWTPDPDQPPSDDFVSFGAYQRTLTLICDHGEPGFFQWTPDKDTPNTVYYQCFSHRYLGWKINVLDECNLPLKPTVARTNHEQPSLVDEDEELDSHSSVQISVRVNPQANYTSTSGLTNQGYINQDTIFNYKLISPVISKPIDDSIFFKNKVDNKQSNLKNSNLIEPNFKMIENKNKINVTKNTLSLSDEARRSLPEIRKVQRRIKTKIDNTTTPLYQHVYNISKGSTNYNVNKNVLKVKVDRPSHPPVMTTVHKRPYSHTSLLHNQSIRPHRKIVIKKPIHRTPSDIMSSSKRGYFTQEAILKPKRVSLHQPQIGESLSVSFSSSKVKPLVSQNKINITNLLRNYPTGSYTSERFNSDSVIFKSGFKPIFKNISETETLGKIKGNGNAKTNYNHTLEKKSIPSSHIHIQSKKSPDTIFRKKMYNRKSNENESQQDELDETAMAAERMDTYYLPPFSPVYGSGSSQSEQESEPIDVDEDSGTIVTYDGKPVVDSHLIPPLRDLQSYNRKKTKGSSADLVRNTPQFGPFRGEIPPPVPTHVRSENIPQLKLSSDSLPSHSLSLQLRPQPKSLLQGRTRLSPISS